ncbi:MAG TPA: NlpC/P60 family protein [Chitinophagaceae bacterium]|nr:NlpC/P60 family protein [Chitinophagaceae bacterium]HNU15566.1 NlpC/P60 family protein [Chitinophagaceae bacterium]
MVKQLVPAFVFIIFLSSCSSFKPLNFTSNRQVSSINEPAPSLTAQAKFIEQISVTTSVPVTDKAEMPDIWEVKPSRTAKVQETAASPAKVEDPKTEAVNLFANRIPAVENASSVQLKYSLLLDTEVESLPSKSLLESVDEWYGVRYRVGGNSKKGVDCSGFTVAVYAAVYGMMLPRISRDQYRISRKISTTELREGDLVFFNTNGRGVSHVGVYLGNNKFIHASVSRGVMVNDLFENYYLRRFVGAGRIDEKQAVVSNE